MSWRYKGWGNPPTKNLHPPGWTEPAHFLFSYNIVPLRLGQIKIRTKNSSTLLRKLMYSACCRRPWGTSRTDQDDDQDLAQLRRKRASHRGQREGRGERDYSCPSSSQREGRGGKDYSCPCPSIPSHLLRPPLPSLTPPPPPSTYPGPERRGGG